MNYASCPEDELNGIIIIISHAFLWLDHSHFYAEALFLLCLLINLNDFILTAMTGLFHC